MTSADLKEKLLKEEESSLGATFDVMAWSYNAGLRAAAADVREGAAHALDLINQSPISAVLHAGALKDLAALLDLQAMEIDNLKISDIARGSGAEPDVE